MFRKNIHIIYYIFLATIILACAKQIRPNGGPADTTPPRMILEESEANYQTRFNKKEFEFKFDEFIQLRSPSRQIFVSPPTTYIPQFEVRTNTLKVKFDKREEFIEDATYQINFGESIVDYNNNNKLKNFNFVFATGDIIDSLTVSGSIRDIVDKKAVSDMTVLLYDRLEDSIVYSTKPLFFTRTGKDGKFQFSNIKSDTFKLFAVADNNLSYTFDNDGEQIAYLDSSFVLTDSTVTDFKLEAFFEKTEQAIIFDDTKTKQIIKLGLKYKNQAIDYSFDQDNINYYSCAVEDSIFIYYDTSSVSFPFAIINDQDSIKVNPRKTYSKRLQSLQKNTLMELLASDTITIPFNECIYAIDDSLIAIMDTSFAKMNILEVGYADKSLKILAELKDTTPYIFKIYPGAVSSYINNNRDTITIDIKTRSLEDYGNISVTCDSLDISQSYRFQLMKSNDIYREYVISGIAKDSFVFNNVLPGTYNLNIIEDTNRDGSWTSGSYKTRTPAERQTSKELEKLRKGWDLNVTFELESLIKKSTQ